MGCSQRAGLAFPQRGATDEGRVRTCVSRDHCEQRAGMADTSRGPSPSMRRTAPARVISPAVPSVLSPGTVRPKAAGKKRISHRKQTASSQQPPAALLIGGGIRVAANRDRNTSRRSTDYSVPSCWSWKWAFFSLFS